MTLLCSAHVLVRNPTKATAPPAAVTARGTVGSLEVVLAQSDAKQWLTWRPDVDAHLLVAAHPHAGGTTALRTAVLGWTAAGGVAYLIDPVHGCLEGLRGWPGVQAVAGQEDPDATQAILQTLHAELTRRYQDGESGKVSSSDLRPILLAIDDYPDFRSWWEHDNARDRRSRAYGDRSPMGVLQDLRRRGRCVRIHLALRTTDCRDSEAQLTGLQRLWIGAAGHQESYAMWSSLIGAEISPRVRGRGICSDAQGQPVKVQVVWTPDPSAPVLSSDDQLQLQALRPALCR